jgi:magnesium and cobalt exporter, CNNM family
MPILEIAIIVLLILANGFLSMSELAIVSARRSGLQTRADNGSRGARTGSAICRPWVRRLSLATWSSKYSIWMAAGSTSFW